jgi:Dynamin family
MIALEACEFNRDTGPAELAATLSRAEVLLETCLNSQSPLLARLSSLRERLAQQRLQLAILGQFKRGKSTFINALLGAPLLPAAVIPVTAIATFIAWGDKPLARISFASERVPEECGASDPEAIRDFLFGFVAEEANPHNRLGVAKAELFYPATILSDGMVLIDTPGIASTLKHNTEAAFRVLPECDAALFVVATDPPITAAELGYLEALKSKVSRIFIIMNKIDYVAAEERKSLIGFLRKVLHERALLSEDNTIFQISARHGLDAKLGNDGDRLEQSGLIEVEKHVLGYLATEKARTLEHAITLKASDILAHASTGIELRVQALKMPLQDLEAKTRAFEHALQRIEEQRRVTGDLLAGDKRRLVDKLESRIAALRDASRSRLAAVIDEGLRNKESKMWETNVQDAVSNAIQELFETAREQVTCECATEADAVLSDYQQRIDELVTAVRRTAAELFSISFRDDIERDVFELGEDPYWVTERVASTLIPDPGRLADRILSAKSRRARMRARLVGNTEQLIVRNAENLRWAILRGLDETFRSAADHLQERLDDAIKATKQVIEQALADRRNRSFAVDSEISRLGEALRSLNGLHGALTRMERVA